MDVEYPFSGEQANAARADHWLLRRRTVRFTRRPRLMGIVNVTPDSFSEGGRFSDHSRAVDHGLELVAEGADLLDVGGESTRPYSTPVDVSEELRRVIPVVQQLCEQSSVPVSIDTSKATVAREALAAGAEIVNDITALTGDAEMMPLVRDAAVGVCAMHMQGTPQTMQDHPNYHDVVNDIYGYLQQRRNHLLGEGIDHHRICLDPGIGFGKTQEQNLTLLADCQHFHGIGCPLLVGHSRKGFIAHVLADKEADRTAGTIGVALSLAAQGVQVIRVHDVQPVRQALLLFESTGGLDAWPATP